MAAVQELKVNKAEGPSEEALTVKVARLKVRESASNDFVVLVDNEVRPKDLVRLDFSLVGKTLHPRDIVRVFPLDNSYMAELVILAAGLGYAQFALLRVHELPKATAMEPDVLAGFDFQQDGATGYWFAIRKQDNQVIGKGQLLKTRKDAVRHVEGYSAVHPK